MVGWCAACLGPGRVTAAAAGDLSRNMRRCCRSPPPRLQHCSTLTPVLAPASYSRHVAARSSSSHTTLHQPQLGPGDWKVLFHSSLFSKQCLLFTYWKEDKYQGCRFIFQRADLSFIFRVKFSLRFSLAICIQATGHEADGGRIVVSDYKSH